MTTERAWRYLQLAREDRVLTVSFDSGKKVNSLNAALIRELTELAQLLQQDPHLSAVVLTGRADTFSGGMDLADPELRAARQLTMAEQRVFAQAGPRLCAAWEALEPVTIAAIEGWCVGGAMALASACDWRVVAEDASLYIPELRLGMNMSWQSIPRLVNLVGPARTKQLLVLADPVDAATAERWGLVDFRVPRTEALTRAQELARRVAAMPPIPVRMTKAAVNAAANALSQAASFMDSDQFLLTQRSEDALEGAAAFLEKRPPSFKGN